MQEFHLKFEDHEKVKRKYLVIEDKEYLPDLILVNNSTTQSAEPRIRQLVMVKVKDE